jgi:hypothetical protein
VYRRSHNIVDYVPRVPTGAQLGCMPQHLRVRPLPLLITSAPNRPGQQQQVLAERPLASKTSWPTPNLAGNRFILTTTITSLNQDVIPHHVPGAVADWCTIHIVMSCGGPGSQRCRLGNTKVNRFPLSHRIILIG